MTPSPLCGIARIEKLRFEDCRVCKGFLNLVALPKKAEISHFAEKEPSGGGGVPDLWKRLPSWQEQRLHGPAIRHDRWSSES
jgi:hypothetical protein